MLAFEIEGPLLAERSVECVDEQRDNSSSKVSLPATDLDSINVFGQLNQYQHSLEIEQRSRHVLDDDVRRAVIPVTQAQLQEHTHERH